MAVVIDETVGGASANSFVSLAEADAYMESRLNASTWESSASTDDKNRALVEATRMLDTLAWAGRTAADTQALAWPRDWVVDPDSPTQDYFDNDELPQRLKDATMELAFQFIKAGTTDVAARDTKLDVVSETIDVISKTYAPHGRPDGVRRYPRVWGLIAPLMARGANQRRTVRG